MPDAAHDAARALIAQRAQLQDWVARLDRHGDAAAEHVVARVRADYGERLRRVLQELGVHLPPLREALAGLQAELTAADARRAAADDELAEVRLRHLIGELDDDAWSARRPELEQRVAAEEEARGRVATQVAELEALVHEIAADAAVPAAASAPAQADAAASSGSGESADAAVDRVFAEWNDSDAEPPAWLAGADEPADGEAFDSAALLGELGDEPGAPAQEDDDLAFLKELDRAIAGSPGEPARTAPPGSAGAARAAEDGLVCKECGAANDPRAWYCEICGMELT